MFGFLVDFYQYPVFSLSLVSFIKHYKFCAKLCARTCCMRRNSVLTQLLASAGVLVSIAQAQCSQCRVKYGSGQHSLLQET